VRRDVVALQRYTGRHIETGLPQHTFTAPHWRHVLVIPAYRESPELLAQLTQLPTTAQRTLVILVLNRPDSDPDAQANTALRTALAHTALPGTTRDAVTVTQLNASTDLYVHDIELRSGPIPAKLGVGLARKSGCDLALLWMLAGGISGPWIACTDADATPPPDYFTRLDAAASDAVAAVFPFRHTSSGDAACDTATALYELRLHHYVLGLGYAGSPYAYHTLGSCLAVTRDAYAHVRGFPQRAGAEDFYLLNKLAKIGPVARLTGACVALQSRHSARVPFGTGPAVAALLAQPHPADAALFYHPAGFAALRAVFACVPELARAPQTEPLGLLIASGLEPRLAQHAQAALQTLGLANALLHCAQQGYTGARFERHFHQWLDGFRTLKFLHHLRDTGWPLQNLSDLASLAPQLWPATTERITDIETLRAAIRNHWQWS
jgi:hypothetical protein